MNSDDSRKFQDRPNCALIVEPLLCVGGDDDQRFLSFSAPRWPFAQTRCRLYRFHSLDPFLTPEQSYAASCRNWELWLAAYPEGAVGDADSSPGDGHCVLQRRAGRVGALVQSFSFTLHLHLHRKPLCILSNAEQNSSSLRCSGQSPRNIQIQFSAPAFVAELKQKHWPFFQRFWQ